MGTEEDALIVALRQAGHERVADALRDKSLAGQLREAGHDGLAAVLEGTQAAPGLDINAMVAGKEAETRALAAAHQWQAKGSPPVPEGQRTDIQAALGLRHNEQVVDGQIRPTEGQED
jgi:hypothetical protein